MDQSPTAAEPIDRERFKALLEQAWRTLDIKRDEARSFLAEARAMLEPSGAIDPVDLATLELCEVAFERFGASIDASIERALACDRVFEEHGDVEMHARANAQIGSMLLAKGEPLRAIPHLQTTIDIRRALDQPLLALETMTALGTAYQESGDYTRAIEVYNETIAVGEPVDHWQSVGWAHNNKGNVYLKLGDFDVAIACYEKALAIGEQRSYERLQGNALANTSLAYRKLQDHDRALALNIAALEVRSKAGDEHGVNGSHVNIASHQASLGNDDVALEHALAAIDGSRRLGLREHLIIALLSAARVKMRTDRRDEALAHIDEAIAEASSFESDERRSNLHQALHEIFRDAGMYDRAYTHLSELYRIDQQVRGSETRRRLHAIETTHEVELAKKQSEIERLRNVELAEALRQLEATHAELKSAQTQLVHAEKMSSLGQLTAGIAHEINNPVNFIRSSTTPLRRDLDEVRAIVTRALAEEADDIRERVEQRMAEMELDELRSEIDALLRSIESGATRTAEIVKGLRTFSRLDEDEFKSSDIGEGIESTLTLLQPRLDGRIVVRRELAELPDVECRPGQINQVVLNLVSNAIDAIEGDGTVTVRTARDGDRVTISIEDTGAGIRPEDLSHIFEPFFTTKPIGTGQGLGLAISHSIIEAHDGSISVSSTVGSGTSFTVSLPIHHTRQS
jgi:signal transduction histidine kinase